MHLGPVGRIPDGSLRRSIDLHEFDSIGGDSLDCIVLGCLSSHDNTTNRAKLRCVLVGYAVKKLILFCGKVIVKYDVILR